MVNDLVFGALECDRYRPQLAYVGPTYGQAKKVAWQYLKDFTRRYDAIPKEAELKVLLPNDSSIYVLGADNADSLRGMYLDGSVLDEYALFKPTVFPQIIRPALSDRFGWSVFASTPRGKNLFHVICQIAKKNPDTWYYLLLSAATSSIIPQEELHELQKDMDPEEFAQEYLCSFDSALKGAIYADEVNELFLDGRAVIDRRLYEPALPTHCALDLGFTDATVCIWFQIHQDGRLAIVACEATQGQAIIAHIERMGQFKGPKGEVFLPHDARAKNLQTGKSIIQQFTSYGITPQIIPNHKVRDGLAAVRKAFPAIWVDLNTTGELLEAMKSYRRKWSDTKLLFEDAPLHDWASDYCDALRYTVLGAGLLGFDKGKLQVSQDTPDQVADYCLEHLHADAQNLRYIRRVA